MEINEGNLKKEYNSYLTMQGSWKGNFLKLTALAALAQGSKWYLKRKEEDDGREVKLAASGIRRNRKAIWRNVKMKWDAVLYLFSILSLSLADLCWAFVDPRGCNRTVRSSVGWIRWTGRMGKCIMRIRAPLRDPQVIELRIRRLQVGVLKNAKCEGAYVRFTDEGQDYSDNDEGRYCGHVTGNTTRLFLRRGPALTIVMDSEVKFAAENPVIFSAQFSILPARLAAERHRGPMPSVKECPLECSYRNDRRKCRLVSPGYPGVYPRGVKCRISLESTTGRFKIGGDLDDVFNLMNYTIQDGCHTENCENHMEESGMRLSESLRNSRSVDDRHRDEDDEIIIGQDTRKMQRPWNRGKVGKTLNKWRTRKKLSEKRIEKSDREKTESAEDSNKNWRMILSNERGFHEKRTSFYRSRKTSKNLKYRTANEEDNLAKSNSLFEHRFLRKYRPYEKFEISYCVGDYLVLYENVSGRILEISKFCGEGHVPQILSRGKNVIVEFFSNSDGTIMHDGFQLTLQEMEADDRTRQQKDCEFVYKSSDKDRESVKSMQSWYPPNTLCSYKFVGKNSERVFVQLKILRSEFDGEIEAERKNSSLNYCPGNEIAVYNGPNDNDTLTWSYCDVFHSDINNIQVPITSTGNVLLIQYYSAKGSFNGQEFTYAISYKFVKRMSNGTKRKSGVFEEKKLISLRPVNFSALNLTGGDDCNCDFSSRIGSFKSWFMALVVLGVISFIGAVLTIVALFIKCVKMRSMENKLLQTPKR